MWFCQVGMADVMIKFTRRKKWPQLLMQELVGSALFCLKPVPGARQSVGSSNGQAMANDWSWKVSPTPLLRVAS
jgi:hypothetical protein